ncbi:MAG: ATP-binding cassette domain-containing protein, partial [Peptococcaceae bacterium]|nr:ATP-binding cassette domain-containing protein [Peptococcaceae bacterium]
MTAPVIQFQNAGKQYPNSSAWALQPLTLDIAHGEFLSIVGSSGGGKTTLLKMINGLLLPSSGKVLVMGQDTAMVDL